MLQVTLLLACGLCRYMWSINTPVAYTLITLAGFGVLFYFAIIIAGVSSYACSFQTPVSIALHSPWKGYRRGMVSFVARRGETRSWIRQVWNNLNGGGSQMTWPSFVEPMLTTYNACHGNITDPEALGTAIRLAGVVRWFEDGTNVEPLYDWPSPPFTHVSISVGRCIWVHVTGHITPDGRSCGSALSRRVNLRSLQKGSLSHILRSRVFGISMSASHYWLTSTQGTPPRTRNRFRVYCCIIP